ncbi:uncharacterized protein F5Z01DRAFT_676153 [Emericellopsis atlantica]|uniref:Copper acquisition factor BIM1-like domain-containing protein n=1 Tax=Emericellopsis atlantica TaxID=2614577 RepID=A0A9P7ZIT4_9HYPO|nr:uncharacterized protein F5Z01DRAFT_676153 [Emericellopsis atlantica]KAG9252273.1 hypothetical protein F5Z01DRAFT_676153 [Emericellopsis atlantica]
MAIFPKLLAGLALSVASSYAQDEDPEYDDFGPAAFMWPEDRVWDAAVDNHAPCGSRAAPRNRTDFPLDNGQVALVAQDESWKIQLGISYKDDPLSNDDFDVIISQDAFKELDPGHTCIPWPKAPDSVSEGDLATLQVKYISEFDTPRNQTFYACADIVWVEPANFNIKVPCFNATEPDNEDGAGDDWDYHDDVENDDDDKESSSGDDDDNSQGSSDSEESNDSDNKKSSGGLSGGAIAGIVVGVLGGLGLIAAAALLIYRRKQQRLRQLRQANSARGVQWPDGQTAVGKGTGSVSDSSVRMQNLSP